MGRSMWTVGCPMWDGFDVGCSMWVVGWFHYGMVSMCVDRRGLNVVCWNVSCEMKFAWIEYK